MASWWLRLWRRRPVTVWIGTEVRFRGEVGVVVNVAMQRDHRGSRLVIDCVDRWQWANLRRREKRER